MPHIATPLTDAERELFWNSVVPALGLDPSFDYSDDDIARHLSVYCSAPTPWHLFLVSDGSGHPVLISAESESASKAEELAIAGARESWDLDEEFLSVEYVGIVDRDINKRF